jgi:hypothetical protein
MSGGGGRRVGDVVVYVAFMALNQLLGCRQSFTLLLKGYDCIGEWIHEPRLSIKDATAARSV